MTVLDPALYWEFRARVLAIDVAQIDVVKAQAQWPNDTDVQALMVTRVVEASQQYASHLQLLEGMYPDLDFAANGYTWDDDAHSLSAAPTQMQ